MTVISLGQSHYLGHQLSHSQPEKHQSVSAAASCWQITGSKPIKVPCSMVPSLSFDSWKKIGSTLNPLVPEEQNIEQVSVYTQDIAVSTSRALSAPGMKMGQIRDMGEKKQNWAEILRMFKGCSLVSMNPKRCSCKTGHASKDSLSYGSCSQIMAIWDRNLRF